MARPRQPIDLIVAKGKKHLSKAEIEERRKQEVKASDDNIEAPSYLPNNLKEEFNKIAYELQRINIMTNLDVDTLARFVISKAMYLKLTSDIMKDSDLLQDVKVLNNQDKLFKQCRASAMDLGLTISSRCRLVIPTVEKQKKELSLEDRLFGL